MGEVERTMEEANAQVSKGPEVEWRDRLLAALLNQGELSLLEQDSDEAHLTGLTTPQHVVLLTVQGGAEKGALSTKVKHILKGLKHGDPVHFVAVGGGSEAARLMKRAAPTFQMRTMGFHHVSSDGSYKRLMGQKLAALPRACANLATTSPPTPEALAAARGASSAVMARESNALTKLRGSYRVTATIVIVCVVLGGLSYLWGPGELHRIALWRMGANNGDAIRDGEVYRLFSSAFLHVDVVHLLVNMIALLSLGPLLEVLTGPRRYLLLYAASGMGGALASALLRPEVLGVGASGAIWGLMTASLGISLRPMGLLPPLMAKRLQGRLWAPLAINALYSLRPGIDLLAHAGGAVVGFLLATTVLTRGLIPLEERSRSNDAEREGEGGLTIAAIATVLAIALSIAVGVLSGRPWTLDGELALERVRIPKTSLSLELPKLVLRGAFYAETKHEDARIFSYGNLYETPVAFEIVVSEFPEATPVDQLDLAMEENRKALDAQGPLNAVKSGSATRVKVGKHEAVRVAHRLGGVELLSYLVLAGRYAVLVRGYGIPPRPSMWSSAEETVASSITSGG
jgi:membrane associated rhomboid family serine protease